MTSECLPIEASGPFRLLVTTAKTPAFDNRQLQITLESLRALKARLADHREIAGRPLKVTWRLTGGMAGELGLPEVDLRHVPSLKSMIDDSEAVITTPSTIYLESVLRKRPTAFLDFHNCPQYVPAAWRITVASQIDDVLRELVNPPAAKMLFQATMLEDQLECHTPATPRMIQLIESMVECQRMSIENSTPLRLPSRILLNEQFGLMPIPCEFDMERLFPQNRAFKIQTLQAMQLELSAAIKQLETLPLELAERQKHIARVNRFLEQAKLRNREMHLRLNRAEDQLRAMKNRLPDL